MTDTIFDKMIRKEIPANVVYEDDDVLAFHDINPQAPVHVLVIPKQKFTGFAKFADAIDDRDVIGRLFQKAAKIAQELNLSDGYRIVVNEGKHGQQSVAYVHVHILGGRQLNWPPG